MRIKYSADAFATLTSLINYIESKNTAGAGLRWFHRYEIFLQKELVNLKHKRLCRNATFKKLNLRCLYFNDWLIAFSINENVILIEAILHKSRVKD
jgi:hypothetical protein